MNEIIKIYAEEAENKWWDFFNQWKNSEEIPDREGFLKGFEETLENMYPDYNKIRGYHIGLAYFRRKAASKKMFEHRGKDTLEAINWGYVVDLADMMQNNTRAFLEIL